MTLRRLFPKTLPLAPLLLATSAYAHPGHPHPFEEVDEFESPAADFAQAVLHPFSGLDHLLAAVMVGCLAYMMGRKLGAVAAAMFMGSLALGWGIAKLGMALPMMEQGLALSVVAAGLMLVMYVKASNTVGFGVIAALGFWHGSAHGVEMASVAPAAGLVAGTGLAVMLGSMAAMLATKLSPSAIKYAGAAAAVAGVVMVVQRVA
ncbi:urease accessory protein [Roseimicrobium gellanilyticum]|uniref:Urease accessory protein n=1 Tax=Roseimicrobium gellanilyticum TaxID=748857 RepID=A0A366HXB4_9BACT|nr:HupE/UreJ family protein [Roseimicrobium gellanilyticum]RBP47958.1 urease accessory protein [Roseimicrobium gellanilyticum]